MVGRSAVAGVVKGVVRGGQQKMEVGYMVRWSKRGVLLYVRGSDGEREELQARHFSPECLPK